MRNRKDLIYFLSTSKKERKVFPVVLPPLSRRYPLSRSRGADLCSSPLNVNGDLGGPDIKRLLIPDVVSPINVLFYHGAHRRGTLRLEDQHAPVHISRLWIEQWAANPDGTVCGELLDAFGVCGAHGEAPREGVGVGAVRYPDDEGPFCRWGVGAAG